MRGGQAQASTFGDAWGRIQETAHDKNGKNGCIAWCRTLASGWWSSRSITRGAVMKGANLGFASVFFKILAQRPSIYTGFGSMTSCACRTPSPSFPIRRGLVSIGFHWDFGWGWQLPVRSTIRHRVGDDLAWATPSSLVREARVGSARAVGKVSAHGHILGRVASLKYKLLRLDVKTWK
jgi:hypothetical protein